MPSYSVCYAFRQRFRIGARRAYEWCTEYGPGDLALSGEPGRRTASWLSDDTLVLTDRQPTSGARTVKKVRLVHLDPTRLSWTSIHLSGPVRYSQFSYRIVAQGTGSSQLEFTGCQLERGRARRSRARTSRRAQQLRLNDSAVWKRLARAMERELDG
ncbi:MAG: hypothetical protein L3J99_07245 [Thermoplasmata archaeon]|nr:hypothetical protein [Thermoplasmata archaeon]